MNRIFTCRNWNWSDQAQSNKHAVGYSGTELRQNVEHCQKWMDFFFGQSNVNKIRNKSNSDPNKWKWCIGWHLPNIKMQAINRTIQNRLSNGIHSVPDRYKPNGMGQQSVKFIKPIIVNAKEIIATGGSPNNFRNITCAKMKLENGEMNMKLIKAVFWAQILTLNTA